MSADRARTHAQPPEEQARIALMKSLRKLSDRLTTLVEMIIQQEKREQR